MQIQRGDPSHENIFCIYFIGFMGIKMTVLMSWFQICMIFSHVITTDWEILENVSKLGQIAFLVIFYTISPISRHMVITQEKFIHIWNQLIKTVILIPINPLKSKNNIFSWEGSPLRICKFKNFRAASRTSSNELKFFVVVPRVISHGKNHSAFLISKVSAKWLTLKVV